MKRNVLKKATALATVFALTSGMAVYASAANTKVAAAEAKKPTTITAIFDTTFIEPKNGQKQFTDKYKELTGVELKVTQPAHNQYYEKVDLAFASNEIPDVLEIGGTKYLNYAVNGALYDMTNLVKNSVALSKAPAKYADQVKVNGRIYGYPIQGKYGCVTYVRQDWMDANKLKAPKTYKEYVELLKVFANDPDKNGKKDTIALTAPGILTNDPSVPMDIYMKSFYQNATPDFVKKDGKWVDGMLQPEMKEALQRMKDAYSQGLFDKEIVTNTTSTCRDKFYAGKVGLFTYWAGSWNKTLDVNLVKNVPNGKVSPLPSISEAKYIERVPTTIAITKKCANPDGVFKYLIEFMHDGDVGSNLFQNGVEGVHYKVNADGSYDRLPSLSDNKADSIKTYVDFALNVEPFTSKQNLDARITNSLKVLTDNSVTANMLPVSQAWGSSNADILTSRISISSKIVVGEISLEDGLKKYETTTKAAVARILKDFNK